MILKTKPYICRTIVALRRCVMFFFTATVHLLMMIVEVPRLVPCALIEHPTPRCYSYCLHFYSDDMAFTKGNSEPRPTLSPHGRMDATKRVVN